MKIMTQKQTSKSLPVLVCW